MTNSLVGLSQRVVPLRVLAIVGAVYFLMIAPSVPMRLAVGWQPTSPAGTTAPPPAADPASIENTATNAQPAFYVHAELNRPTRDLREGDQVVLTVKTEEDAYLYILYQQADGKIFQIFPNADQTNSRVAAKTPVQVPASADLFRWEVGPPFGREMIKVIASRKPIEPLSRAELRQKDFNPVTMASVKQAARQLTGSAARDWAEVDLDILTYPKDHEAEANEGRRFGVFFGVSKYLFDAEHRSAVTRLTEGKQPGGLNLVACDNDANNLGAMLRDVGQLSDGRTFIDADATRANLEYAITRWLPSVSRPGDTVFIHFAGHGSQIPDDNGDEADGKDEALIPADFVDMAILSEFLEQDKAGTLDPKLRPRVAELLAIAQQAGDRGGEALVRATGVSDDLFGRWLQKLSGRQVVVLLDTCHSGGFATREKSLTAVPEAVPMEFDFLESELPRLKDIGERDQALISAALAAESAVALTSGDNGVFTGFLLESFRLKPGPLKLEDSFQYCCDQVPKYFEAVNRARQEQGAPPITPHRQHLINFCSRPVYLKP
jgi:hypothetical protein